MDLAKQSLPELQALDPNVILNDVKNTIYSVGSCVTLALANEALDEYAASLSSNDPTPTNNPPEITGSPATTGAEGVFYSFKPNANDADPADSLSFSVSGQPVWASFNPADGTLAGTPDYDDAGSYGNIEITVTDGKASASLGPFSVNVANTNRQPSISGIPNTEATSGVLYTFSPTFDDPDEDDHLTFSITNPPEWADFNPDTGALSGYPDNANTDYYSDIVITVSDGTDSDSMLPFSITVITVSDPSGSAQLSWQPPGTRTDGTYLEPSEIGGYHIYMGTTSDNLSMIADLNNGSQTDYSVTDLAVGSRYYFAVTAYDVEGNESGYSNIEGKDI
jgi:hypothetical protein